MKQKLVGGSVSFDHAADEYDATRALPPEVVVKQTEAILAELRAAGAERLLEVGIGTGRIARPLMARGVRVTGVDIAPRMLARLREQLTPAHAPPDLLFGDATRLPFRNASFRAVVMAHVLHLVSDWRQTIDELRRVLAPGGLFLHDVANYDLDPNPWHASLQKRDEIFTREGVARRARPDPGEIRAALRAAGGAMRTVVYATDVERNKPADFIERVRGRVDSWTWEVPQELHAAFLAEYAAWCRDHYGDLEREFAQRVQYELQVWTVP